MYIHEEAHLFEPSIEVQSRTIKAPQRKEESFQPKPEPKVEQPIPSDEITIERLQLWIETAPVSEFEKGEKGTNWFKENVCNKAIPIKKQAELMAAYDVRRREVLK